MIATPTEIEYFIETYNIGHISRAAIRLNITQPTLTQSIMRLEEKLGYKLFVRSKQGVTPTKVGSVFYKNAKGLLENWKNIQNDVHALSSDLRGNFKLGLHASVGTYVLPAFFKSLEAKAPLLDIQLVHDHSRKILEQVVANEIDFGVVINPIKHPDLVMKKILNDEMKFWVHKNTKNIPQKIFLDMKIQQSEYLINKTYKKHFQDWKMIDSSSLDLIKTLVLNGRGIGILPTRIAQTEQGELIEYNKALPSFLDELYFVYKVETAQTVAAKEIVKIFHGLFKQ